MTTRDLEKELLNTNWARTTQFNLDECQLPASAYIHHWVKDPQDPQYQQSGARLGNWYLQDKLSNKEFCELEIYGSHVGCGCLSDDDDL